MTGQKRFVWLAALIALLATAGCGDGDAAPQGALNSDKTGPIEQDTTPITLQLYAYNALTDEEFAAFFSDPVKKKYPHITMELVKSGQGLTPRDLINTGSFPDIILTSANTISVFEDLDLTENAETYIKKYDVDLNRYDPTTLQAMRINDGQQKLAGLPYAMNYAVLYYNKDIFDKFGFDYPRDGMSWNDAIELARKMTRTDSGVDYQGIDPTGITRVGSGLSLPYVDPKTNKPLIDSDGWNKSLTLLKELYNIPGVVKGTTFKYGTNAFTKEKSLAMLAEWGNLMSGTLEKLAKDGDKLNWDMASLPNFMGLVGTGRETDLHALLVSKTGKHKDQAFQVISLIGSDEVQQTINSSGRLTVLKKNDAFKKSFGSALTSMKGKNFNAIFSVTPSPNHVPSLYDNIGRTALNNAEKAVALNQKDVNTALRDAQEEASKAIQSQLAK